MNQLSKEQLERILSDIKKYWDKKLAELKASGIAVGSPTASVPTQSTGSPTINPVPSTGTTIPIGSTTPTSSTTAPATSKPKTPQEIEDEKWEAFFTKKGITNKAPWKTVGLNQTEAETAFDNGWQDSSIIKGKTIPIYSSEGQNNTNLNPLTDKKATIDANNKEKTRLKAEWDAFYNKHSISASDQSQWGSIAKPTDAEAVYANALSGSIDSKPLDATEQGLVNNAKTPNAIQQVLKDIPYSRFFTKHAITVDADKTAWKAKCSTAVEAETIYVDTLRQATDDEEKKIVNDAKNPADIDKAVKQDIPWKRFYAGKAINDTHRKAWLTTGLTPEEAQKAWVHGWKNVSYPIVNKVVPNYIYKKGTTPVIAIDNLNVDVLNFDQGQLNHSCHLLYDIQTCNTFAEIKSYITEDRITGLSDSKLPVGRKQADIRVALKAKTDTMRYVLDEPKDGGLEKIDFPKAEQAKVDLKPSHTFTGTGTQPHPTSGYGIWTVDILNEFLNASDLKISETDDKGIPKLDSKKNPITTPFKVSGNTIEDLDEPNSAYEGVSFLQSQKAFKLPKDMTDKEDRLSIKTKGMYLLPHFYKENKYDPDNPTFCKYTEAGGKKEIKVQPKGHPEAGAPLDLSGLLAIATGVGKTTKTINCLINGGKRNVILVCPNGALCASAAEHHRGWLQPWGCVVHQVQKKDSSGNLMFEEFENSVTRKLEKESVFESHGTYPVELNNLCHYEDESGNVQGNKGLSVLELWALLAYLDRKLWSTKPNKKEKSGKEIVEDRLKIFKKDQDAEKAQYEKWIKEAVSKFIPKGTIIAFDEGHFGTAEYQTMIKEVIFLSKELGFEVIKMSATFKGIPFSSTSTFPRVNMYMSSLQPKFKSGGKEYDLNEILKNDKFWLFLPNVENGLNPKQQAVLNKYDLSHVVFNQPYEKSCESISFGMPPSTGMFIDGSKEMGFSPDIGLVITTNIMETSNLQTNWEYSTPNYSWISLASFAQQIGRTARFRTAKGEKQDYDCAFAITISKELEEFVIKPDVAVYVIQGALSADATALTRLKTSISDANHLRGSIALANEDNKKWGLYPAELVVGTGEGTAGYPKWGKAKATFRVDPTLMEKHMGTWTPPKLEASVAKDIMDLMIATYIRQPKPKDDKSEANNFPYEVNVEMKSDLIGDYGLEPVQVKRTLNGVIDQRLKEIEKQKAEPDKMKYKFEEKPLFDEAVGLYKLALGAEINKNILVREEVKDKKKFWVMRINYKGVIPATT